VAGERFCLWDRAAIEGVLDRIALEAAALLRGEEDPLLLGILRRGAPLAQMLQSRLSLHHGLDVPRYGLKLKRYGDDLALVHPDTELTENAEFSARELARATVLVVDDVLYRGHSLARVLAYLSQRRAPVIRAAVLADRCVAQLPVHADIVGIRLQVAPGDIVECNVPPYEDDLRIELLRPREAGEAARPSQGPKGASPNEGGRPLTRA
jgi:pyrimidine operon attenuation protein/uracil phosphoribosyltransferase